MDLLHSGRFDDFVWSLQTAILPALPPASVSKASMFLGSVSKKLRRAFGKPVEGLYTENLIPGSQDAPSTSESLLPPSAATPIIKKIITQMESEDGWVTLRDVGTGLANLASDFDPRTFGFRKLGNLVRKTNSFEVDHPKGGSMRIRARSAAGLLRNQGLLRKH